MPSAAAALVTSPSLAAPSSIEYSVCTCRCTKFSEAGVLTVRGAPHGSCSRLFPHRDRGGGSIWVTGGEGRFVVLVSRYWRGLVLGSRIRVSYSWAATRVGAPILALPQSYSEGPTERVSPIRTTPGRTPCPAGMEPPGLAAAPAEAGLRADGTSSRGRSRPPRTPRRRTRSRPARRRSGR